MINPLRESQLCRLVGATHHPGRTYVWALCGTENNESGQEENHEL